MPISGFPYTSASAMNVAGLSLQVEANNIANMNTRGFEASTVIQAEAKSGGVTAEIKPTGDPAPAIIERGEFVKLSNTNAIGATVSRAKAIAMYRANAAVLDIGANLDETLLDIIA